MRISNSSPSKTGSRRTEKSDAGRGRSTGLNAVTNVTGGEDTVAISGQNELVAQALHGDIAARIEHVDQLKSALESGTYVADAAEVSRAVVTEALTSGNE